jgi:hypothetical protein
MNAIQYRSGYRYQLAAAYSVQVNIFPDALIRTEFIDLTPDGWLTMRRGYAWDGASGPTLHTRNTFRGSLVHDALYQLMREEHLPRSWRRAADLEMQRILCEDGMTQARAFLWYRAVRRCGGPAATNRRVIYTAP